MATRKTPEKKPAPVKPAKDTVPPGKSKDNAGKKTPPKITSEIVIEAAKKIALNPREGRGLRGHLPARKNGEATAQT